MIMRKMMARALAVLVPLAAAITLTASPALASAGCAGTSGCSVYKLTGIVLPSPFKANASLNGVALGAVNNATVGSRLELRNFSVTRTAEQFVLNENGELQLGGTSLCVTGRLHTADLETCSAPTVWNSQNWSFSDGVFTNVRGRSLMAGSTQAYTTVTTSTSGHATWAASVVTR